MAYPTLPRLARKLPSSTKTFTNGDPPAHLLRDPGDRLGPLLVPASYGMQAMHIHAARNGFKIETTGRGRSLDRQTDMFLERYTPSFNSTVNTTSDPRTCKLDQRSIHPQLDVGHIWYKRHGKAAAASPGTSNHGWYCADDMSEENDSDAATDPVSERLVRFLMPIAHGFGWTWELQSEPWHVSWIAGDEIPKRAKQVLDLAGVTYPGSPDPQPPTPPEDDMQILDKPYRSYDSREHGDPLRAGNTIRVPVSPYASKATVRIGSIGQGGAGFLFVNGAADTSLANFTPVTPVNSDVVPVMTPDGHITITAVVSAAHFTVDVYAVA